MPDVWVLLDLEEAMSGASNGGKVSERDGKGPGKRVRGPVPAPKVTDPYYDDEWVTIYHGDCWEHLSLAGSSRVITDPPYGTATYETDCAPAPEVMLALVQAQTAAIFGYPERLARLCVELGVLPDEWVTWWPTNTIGGQRRAKKLPRECEHIAIFGDVPGASRLFRPRSSDTYARRLAEQRGLDPDTARLGDVWRDSSPGASANRHLRRHPNEKPESLMGRLVQLCSEPGDTVFDPFMGSGTTLRAAKDLGRRAIGVEIEERFCEIAAERMRQEVLVA